MQVALYARVSSEGQAKENTIESQVKEMKKPDFDAWLREFCQKMAEGEEFELGEAFYRIEIPD